MSVTNHERPGVYSRYDASTVVKGRGGGGCVGLAALCGTGTAGTLYTFNRYEEAVTAFGGEETLTELVRLLFLNGAAQVKAVPVAEEAGYKAAFSVLEAAEDIAVVVCDSGPNGPHQRQLIREKCSMALANSAMVRSASPCSMPSRTQWLRCPSSTTCPTLCSALLAALICISMSSQGTS